MIENLPNEIWVVHPKYTEYAASNLGRIKHLANDKSRKEKLMKLSPNKDGYLQFTICKDGKGAAFPYVHRFCYECFNQIIIPKDRKKYQINHKSEVRTENFIENLELVTAKENMNYGSRNKRAAKSMINNPKVSKRVAQYTIEGKLIKIWKSTMEAEREGGFQHSAVSKCCNNKYYYNNSNNIYKGFIWKYIEE